MVDAAHISIIRQDDCGTKKFITIDRNEENRQRFFARRILGRLLATDVVDPQTKKIIARQGDLVDEKLALVIENSAVTLLDVRSPLTCQALHGLCRKCYGWDLSTRKMVVVGTPVGVIAAQSVGEPGTQLTLRTKHTGGVLGVDVTQGLPRIQELFEIRTPKLPSPLAEVSGKVQVKDNLDGYEVKLKGKDSNNQPKVITYLLPSNVNLLVADGDLIAQGAQICSGSLDVRQILNVSGIAAAQKYLISSIQFVYESQGISIHDKHIETIVREMSNKIKIDNPGDTTFIYGQVITKPTFKAANKKIEAEGGSPARGSKVLLGLIKSALSTGSWLSAASFQQTTSVLTESSLIAETDNLIGLKENVIIGRLIPVSENQEQYF